MSEEIILVKSEDDENVPKSPVYLSETTSESSKQETISVKRSHDRTIEEIEIIDETSDQEEVVEVGNNDSELVPLDLADEIALEMDSNKISKSQAVHVQRIDLTEPLELMPSTSSKVNTDKPAEGEHIEIRHESTESSESEKRNDSPIEITSSLVNRWARDQQTKDLEEGEIIDDDLQIVSVSQTSNSKGYDIDVPLNTIVSSLTSSKQSYSNSLTNKLRGKQRGKKGRNKKNKNKENQLGKNSDRIPKNPGGTHKRIVTVNKNFKTFKSIPWSTNNSGNQENHSWPSPDARETVNANDIDRRLDVGRKGDDYSKLLQEYESVQSQLKAAKTKTINETVPTLIRVLDSDDEEDIDDDVSLDILRERALESATRRNSKPSLIPGRIQNRGRDRRLKTNSPYESMIRKADRGKWKTAISSSQSNSMKSSRKVRTRSISIQVSPDDFDRISPTEMDISNSDNELSNNSASKSSMIYINPNSSAENSAHSSKRGSRAGIDVEEDGDEAEEARLRSMLLKQIGRKRSKSRESKKGDFSNPDSPNTVMINPVKINPTVMHSVDPQTLTTMIPIQPLVIPSTAVAQYHLGYTDRMPKASTSLGLEFSNTPPPTMTSTSAPASPPRSSSAPLDVGSFDFNKTILPQRSDTATPDPQATLDQLIQFDSGPDIPSLIPSPPPSNLPSNYNGRILPLLQPQIICDIGESSSSDEESDSDLDEMSSEKLNAKMSKAKDKLRQQQLKTEKKKLLLKDLKQLRKTKFEDRKKVKEALTLLIERQTNYEQYLKDVFGFITDVKQRQNDAKLEIYQSDKNMVELKMKINEIRARLGLEGEEIDEKKMVEIDRLHRKKIELEQKLNELAASMSKQKQKVTQQESQVQEEVSVTPQTMENNAASGSKTEESVLTAEGFEKCKTFEEITNWNLPTLSVKIGLKSSVVKNDESSKITTIAKNSPKIDWSFGKIDFSEIDGFYTQEYKSPLRIFRSYRLSPFFRQQDFEITSHTYSHKLDPNTNFCGYNLTGKCNDTRCTGQHWRDVVLTPDELYLDLLSYSGELIKLSTFTEYTDKLKASAAFVNRVLPPELSLNLSQKCLFLVEEINSQANVKEPNFISTYAKIDKFSLQHNKRKAGSILSSVGGSESKRKRYDSTLDQSYDQLQLDDENEGPRYFMPEDEHEDENEPEEELKPSLQAIKELEDLTLKEPKNITAWLQLERRLTKSYLPKKYELGLACLAEGLNFNPSNGKLWRRYWILFNQTYPEADRNDDFRKKKTEIKEFCEENVDLGCDEFWSKYVNMEKSFSSKAEVLEKYISRLLQNQMGFYIHNYTAGRNTDLASQKNFEFQFASAILYRAYLMTLEGSVNDAQDFIMDFIKLCPLDYSSDHPKFNEYRENHDDESNIEFEDSTLLGLLLSLTHLIIKRELPGCLQSPRFKILSRKDLYEFKSELVTFDTTSFIFTPEEIKREFNVFTLTEESKYTLAEIYNIFLVNTDNEEGWNGDNKMLVLQLYELFERTIGNVLSDKELVYMRQSRLWTYEFELLKICVDQNYILSEYMIPYCDRDDDYRGVEKPEIRFPLAYYMFGSEHEEGLAHALTYLEATIGEFYSGKIADVENMENIEDDCDEPILIAAFKKVLQISMSNKEPLLNTTKKLPKLKMQTIGQQDPDLEWLWCSFLLLLSICNDSDALDKYFELALSSIKSDCPCLWFYYVKWSCSNKSPSDVANLIHRFTARHSSSHLTANFLHLYFSMDKKQNGNQVATDLLHNISSISINVTTLVLCAKIFYDNEQYAKTKSVLHHLIQRSHENQNIDAWKLYIAAERKINDRNVPELIRTIIERFYTSREMIRLGVLYWKNHSDQNQKKNQLEWIKNYVTSVGHISISTLFE